MPRVRRRANRLRRWAFVLLTLAVAAGAVAFKHFPQQAAFLGPILGFETVTGRVTHVRDGDTIEVKGMPIRLSTLGCAERGTSEGERAARRMRMLVAGQQLTCRLSGRRSYDRDVGRCWLDNGRSLGEAMIGEGYCGRY